MVKRLDLFGGSASGSLYAGENESPHAPCSSLLASDNTPPRSPAFSLSHQSLQNAPALLSIVDRAQTCFAAKLVIITILQGSHPRFLASRGLPEGLESLPRDASFCTHAILNGDAGLVILDTQKDWR